MKIIKLILILSLFAPSGLFAMQQEQQPPIKSLPVELQNFIAKNLIDTTFEKSLNNIASFAQVDKEFNQIMNDPDNMIWLVNVLSKRFPKFDEVYIAKGLANMPGVKGKEFQDWIMPIMLGQKLRKAAAEHNFQKVKKLLSQGANVNSRDKNNETALYYLLSNIQWREVDEETYRTIELLLNAGADINARNSSGSTPIIQATMYQNPEIMKEILKYNPNLMLADHKGRTAIHFAAVTNPILIEILREYIQSHGIILSPDLSRIMQILQEPE